MTADEKKKNDCRVQVRLSLQALDQIIDNPPADLTPSELEGVVSRRAQQLRRAVDTLYATLAPTLRTR